MSKDNPYGLVVNVENAKCVVEFDVLGDSEINYETWEVFFRKRFKGLHDGTFKAEDWVQVNDLIHDKTWESIDDQIKAQWDDVIDQMKAYDEHY